MDILNIYFITEDLAARSTCIMRLGDTIKKGVYQYENPTMVFINCSFFPLDMEGSPVFILGTVLYKTLGLMLPSPK